MRKWPTNGIFQFPSSWFFVPSPRILIIYGAYSGILSLIPGSNRVATMNSAHFLIYAKGNEGRGFGIQYSKVEYLGNTQRRVLSLQGPKISICDSLKEIILKGAEILN